MWPACSGDDQGRSRTGEPARRDRTTSASPVASSTAVTPTFATGTTRSDRRPDGPPEHSPRRNGGHQPTTGSRQALDCPRPVARRGRRVPPHCRRGAVQEAVRRLVVTRIEEERRALRDRLTTGLTLGEVAERWLTSLERTRRRPSTIASYRATWRGTLAPVLHSRPVDALTRAEIQQVLLDGLFARHPGTWAPDGSWTPGHYRLDDQGRRIPLQGEQPRAVMKMLLRFAADRGYPPTAPTPLTARRHQNAEHPSFER